MNKKYVYEVHSDVVSDVSYVVAESPSEAIVKYKLWWSKNQSREISEDSITRIEKTGEIIDEV